MKKKLDVEFVLMYLLMLQLQLAVLLMLGAQLADDDFPRWQILIWAMPFELIFRQIYMQMWKAHQDELAAITESIDSFFSSTRKRLGGILYVRK